MAAIDLIVLGMIKQQPQSAYELQKNVEYRNISRWVKISTLPYTRRLSSWRRRDIWRRSLSGREICRRKASTG